MDGYSRVFNNASQKFQEITDKDGLFSSFRANKAIYGFIENGDKAPDKEAIDLSKAYNLPLYEHYISQLKDRNSIGYNGSSQQYAIYNELDSRHIMMSVFLFTKIPESPTTIIEIGGGYGNWFYLNRQQLFNSWVTIDLPHVCELQSWYLSQMNIDLTKWKTISTNNCSEYSNKPVDLVIGSHSLSEFSLPIFQNYFNTIVRHSKYFYYCYHMTMPTSELIYAKLDIIHKQFTVVDSFISEKGKVMNCLYKNKKDSTITPKKTVCLNMIVKNEAHIIEGTLAHLLRFIHFDYWVISDTGSTDTTREIIKNFFSVRGISGELVEHEWRDFGYNRTKAFESAYNKTDYVFVWDADDEIYGEFHFPENLDADSYKFTLGNANGMRYSRPQLFNNRKRWCYKGVLHEYANCLEPCGPIQSVVGSYYFISGRKGDRSKDPNKYLKDALILEKAATEALVTGDPLYNRYIFYCAQSYNSCGNREKAIEYYKKALTLNLWIQEKYVACYEIYNNYEQLNQAFEGLSYLVESYKYDKTRIEGVYRLIQYYCIQGSADIAYMYYTLIQDFFENRYDPKNLGDKLFAKKAEYEFYLPYYMIIVGERTKRHSICIQMYETIFKYKYVAPQWWMNNLLHNLQFCIPYLPKDSVFLSKLVDYIDVAFAAGIHFNSRHYEIVTSIIHHYSPQFTVPCAIVPRTSNIQIMLTMTTCKRFDLFEKTVKSILCNWTDINKIDYFYCVDDNSSEEDRLAMRCSFPFFDYYMKSPEERGHRESMNLIWNKLNEVKPTYWIHLEDDWLYFRKEAYVSRAIKYLTMYEDKNVHQVVFNRNYGVVYGDLERNGGIRLEDGFILHEKRGDISGKNCGYWPHYSLQPSISRASKILELGNYDSSNKFFERDYANKYFACEYMTGFFDSVYSIHIGKQHWEKDGKNAYKLNEVSQFNSEK